MMLYNELALVDFFVFALNIERSLTLLFYRMHVREICILQGICAFHISHLGFFSSACFDKVVLGLLFFYTMLCSGLRVQDGVKIFTIIFCCSL